MHRGLCRGIYLFKSRKHRCSSRNVYNQLRVRGSGLRNSLAEELGGSSLGDDQICLRKDLAQNVRNSLAEEPQKDIVTTCTQYWRVSSPH